jgi:hypothetical protein
MTFRSRGGQDTRRYSGAGLRHQARQDQSVQHGFTGALGCARGTAPEGATRGLTGAYSPS